MARMTRVNRFTVPIETRERFVEHLRTIRDTLHECPAAYNVRLMEAADGELALIYEHVGPDGAAECARFLDSRHVPEERHAVMLTMKVHMQVRSYRHIGGSSPG
ncbi:hypothetical protein [Pseudoroseicyclus tamaricis]|uniref:Antibiotic biosynthesis monooxygenase n=1 Tax=Pseudoroseicyclus tamaricis TaxID=2705421 RepID=A0A6B2JHE0_9RHOB|nr:hypothetical protein [Pseudoroseicyclus tamaricis]NDV00701.1 hypothetical protein [Pseudoroseicyclus tamaricis]